MDPVEILRGIVARATAVEAPLEAGPALVAVALAAVLVLVPAAWRITRHAVTIVHEAGHGLAATLSGRRLAGIRLHSDTSGLTVSVGRPRGPGMVVTLLAGYPAPALAGLAAAWLAGQGRSAAVLWLWLVLLALVVIQVRNWFGLWSCLVAGVAIGVVAGVAPLVVQGVAAHALALFLLLGALRATLELQRSRSRRGGGASDADQLGRLTHLPAVLWVGVLVLVAAACLVGGALLLGIPTLLGA
ncbi:M50 family metallopeptidase [Clavibacter zhangzhiyongii]|uniref:M50 family metallopeptidase n=1 Tax=Clavibacter zhangzhiyongii TaxID=2768071 RepID=UPI0039DFD00A